MDGRKLEPRNHVTPDTGISFVKSIEMIRVISTVGNGTPDSPVQRIASFYTKEGRFVGSYVILSISDEK